jgi:hypothetical protein
VAAWMAVVGVCLGVCFAFVTGEARTILLPIISIAFAQLVVLEVWRRIERATASGERDELIAWRAVERVLGWVR